jgi:hypothetical protein
MSEKYNRNDATASKDVQKLSDYVKDLNGVEEDERDFRSDIYPTGVIVSGLTVYNNETPDQYVNIADDPDDPQFGGVAYDEYGERIYLPNPAGGIEVDTTQDAVNYACVRHKYSYVDTRAAKKDGTQWFVTKYDDFEIVVRTQAEGIQEGDICLAKTTGQGSSVTISFEERHSPDLSGGSDAMGPPKVYGVAVTTGLESDNMIPAILTTYQHNPAPKFCWVKVEWIPVTDPSGIREYEVTLTPVDSQGDEAINQMIVAKQSSNYTSE